MKRTILTCLLCVITTIASVAQCTVATNNQWFGSGATLCSGTYNNIGWAGQMKIPAGATVTLKNPNYSSGSLVVEAGATLIVTTDFYTNGISTVNGTLICKKDLGVNTGHFDCEGTVEVDGDFDLSNPANTIAGKITVSGSTTLHNCTTTFTNCGQLITCTLKQYSAPNPIGGSGFIQITGSYVSNGNALTSSGGITVSYSGSGNFGSAQRSNHNPCVVLPITYKAGTFKVVKVLY